MKLATSQSDRYAEAIVGDCNSCEDERIDRSVLELRAMELAWSSLRDMTAAWATAVIGIASFLLGVVVPFIYRRFTNEGYSIRAVPWALFGPIAVKIGDRGFDSGVFGAVKVANGTADALLIDDFRVNAIESFFESATKGGVRQSLFALEVDRAAPIVFPPADMDLHRWATLPLVIEPGVEREIALWFSVDFADGGIHRPLPELKSMDLALKVSGKSRRLKVRPGGSKAASIVLKVDHAQSDAQLVPFAIYPPGTHPSHRSASPALGLRAGESLSDVDLHGVALGGARLDHVSLDHVQLDGAQMADVDLRMSSLHYVELREAVLTNAQLNSVAFRTVILDGAQMTGVDLRMSTFHDVELRDTVMTNAQLDRVAFHTVILDRAQMTGANCRWATLNDVTLVGADLTRASLARSVLNKVRLDDAQMESADLAGIEGQMVEMRGANASRAVLTRAQLPNADLSRVDLRRADLRWANLRGALLIDADLRGAKLHGADFSAADLTGAALPPGCQATVRHDSKTRWPNNHALPQ